MALSLRDCTFFGPALPEPFVLNNLEAELNRRQLLPRSVGDEGREIHQAWEVFRRKLRDLGEHGGDRRVYSHVLEPLASQLGYETILPQDSVITREGGENGGSLFLTQSGQTLRVWAAALGTDLDAPNRRGRAYRFSPSRVAQRVLLASGERAGLLTDGEELRLLICDPARPDSHIAVDLGRSGGWRSARNVPDSYRLLRALASPSGVAALPDLTDKAREAQTKVTEVLRVQARRAIEGFLQEVLDHPENQSAIASIGTSDSIARNLWHEGLILVYRLLFIFKLESSADPARAFSFASTTIWRNTYSPNTALAPVVRGVLDGGADTGGFLESGLRALWRMFAEGMSSTELEVKPLGGMLFGRDTTPLLDSLKWGEQSVARLLDALLWTVGEGRAQRERERVHYGALDVEDLGRVYEALLELDPGISSEPMCRLKRGKIEVVVPLTQGRPHMSTLIAPSATEALQESATEGVGANGEGSTTPTNIQYLEEIQQGKFYLRVGFGRKASGSYYTPHPFVRFLVQETLGPLLLKVSPKEDPRPGSLLELKVLDPAMGSGHFLVEACRYLGDALYEACRLCDELAIQAEEEARAVQSEEHRAIKNARAAELWKRVEDLPDPDDELLAYLPSRVSEGEQTGLSQKRAEALCRRLVAVHCIYGVDKNPLAVELAKLSLWLESFAEGLPLTFMDHRLVRGDSLTGPSISLIFTNPKTAEPIEDLYAQGLSARLNGVLRDALGHVRDLDVSVGKDVADLEHKRAAKQSLDIALAPFKTLAAAWTGGVILGGDADDEGYQLLAQRVAEGAPLEDLLEDRSVLGEMVAKGRDGLTFELVFPEVFYQGTDSSSRGFHVLLGNPPWEGVDTSIKEFFGAFDITVFDAEGAALQSKVDNLLSNESIARQHEIYQLETKGLRTLAQRVFSHVNRGVGQSSAATLDLYQAFWERSISIGREGASLGMVLPSSFHANEGASGLRNLSFVQNSLKYCYSFENRKKLFDIHSSYKFAAVILNKVIANDNIMRCAFYLHDMDWLFEVKKKPQPLDYSLDFITSTTGQSLNLLELRKQEDVPVVNVMYASKIENFGEYRRRLSILPSEELHTSKQRHRAVQAASVENVPADDLRVPPASHELASRGYFPVLKGEHFHQFDPTWESSPTLVVPLANLGDRVQRIQIARHFRLVFRRQASSTNERTVISYLSPPGLLYFDSALPERAPEDRPNFAAMITVALVNSFPFDWIIRQLVSANVTFNFLDTVPVPSLRGRRGFLAHTALRLSCAHSGYESLWKEQLGEAWREASPRHSWPVLEGEARIQARASIDAILAHAYGLSREHYAYVLATFNHASYPSAPTACLAAFDELLRDGEESFKRNRDPYWDIPLHEDNAQPMLELPSIDGGEEFGPLFGASAARPEPLTSPRAAPRPPHTESNQAYDTLKALLQDRGDISSGDAQDATGLDAAGVRPLLRRLVDEGLAETEGQRRGMRYRRLG